MDHSECFEVQNSKHFRGCAPKPPGGRGAYNAPQLLLHSLLECGSLRSYARKTFRPTDKLPFSSLYAFQMESVCRQKKLRLQAANIFVDHWLEGQKLLMFRESMKKVLIRRGNQTIIIMSRYPVSRNIFS